MYRFWRKRFFFKWSFLTYIIKYALRPRKKKPCSTGEEIPKNGRSADTIFFFLHFFDKITRKKLKYHNFFLLTSLAIFHSNFCQKNGWFYNFFSVKKKIQQMEKKRSVAPVEQVFFFLTLSSYLSSTVLDILSYFPQVFWCDST